MTEPNTPIFNRVNQFAPNTDTLDEQIDKMFPTWFKKLQVTFSGELPLSQDDRQQVLVVPYPMFKTAIEALFTEHSKEVDRLARIDELEKLLKYAEENELSLEARQTYAPEAANIDIELTVLAQRLTQLKRNK